MKTLHTRQVPRQILAEDMSVCDISDDDEVDEAEIQKSCNVCDFEAKEEMKLQAHLKDSHAQNSVRNSNEGVANERGGEELLIENKSCNVCDFEAKEDMELERHLEESHTQQSVSNLNEDVIKTNPPVEKSQPLYKCNECSFVAESTDHLKEHKKELHKEKTVESETIFLHTCISCNFKTNDYSQLTVHIDESHRSIPVPPKPQPEVFHKCDKCEFQTECSNELNIHATSNHTDTAMKNCNLCDFTTTELAKMKEHIETTHCPAPAGYILRALSELTGVVRNLAKDILQIRADSILINRDIMEVVKGDITEEINENVNSKFEIVDKRVDHLFQQLVKQDYSSNKSDVTATMKSMQDEKVPVVDIS